MSGVAVVGAGAVGGKEQQDESQSDCEAEMSDVSDSDPGVRIPVPHEFFVYTGAGKKDGNSLYRCMKCSSKKIISCNDRSRLNLRKHVTVQYISNNIVVIVRIVANFNLPSCHHIL